MTTLDRLEAAEARADKAQFCERLAMEYLEASRSRIAQLESALKHAIAFAEDMKRHGCGIGAPDSWVALQGEASERGKANYYPVLKPTNVSSSDLPAAVTLPADVFREVLKALRYYTQATRFDYGQRGRDVLDKLRPFLEPSPAEQEGDGK